MNEVALFDFDRTLTQADSFQTLIWDTLKAEWWRGVLIFVGLPVYILTWLFQWDRQLAKSWILWSCTVGLPARLAFERLSESGRRHRGSALLAEGVNKLHELQEAGVRIIVCTASAPEWVGPYLEGLPVRQEDIVGSLINYRFGGIIMTSKNCYGKEKVARLQTHLRGTRVRESYSDHPSDIPLLHLAEHGYVVSPKAKHLATFRQNLTIPFTELPWNGAR